MSGCLLDEDFFLDDDDDDEDECLELEDLLELTEAMAAKPDLVGSSLTLDEDLLLLLELIPLAAARTANPDLFISDALLLDLESDLWT